jgi:hypothetical protein
MGCLLALVALLLPRLAIVLIFLFTNWLHTAYATWIVPLLGFLFMPYTTLAYMYVVLNLGRPFTLVGWLIILLAVLLDIGHWGGGYRTRRKKVVVREV